ncbi:MAG TPA: TIR domain-containing protein [Pirellulales bacterium]|jgi:hypothetical protein|nr:TIR domain-containing protein [Pirellulales bacterium]
MAGHKFDVFLSHNGSDKPAVEELAQRLRTVGLEPWLDKWNLVPGDPWQPVIEEALRDSATCAVFVGPSGLGAWQHEETRAAINRRVSLAQKGDRFRVLPVLLPGAVRGDRSKLPEFLTATTWVEFHKTLDEDAFRILERAIRGLPPGPDQPATITECPYRGLEFFDVQHAPLYFGRAAITDWLLSALRGTLSAQGPTRFLAIIGASGSGKSSLARAGLLAALKNGGIDGSADWLTTICRPGPGPLESLAKSLSETDGVKLGQGLTANLIQDLKKALLDRPNALHQTALGSLGDAQPERRLAVLVDQFEELFAVCRDDAERQAFIGNLLYAARVAQGQTVILLTMRADFYGKCASHPELAAAISEHQFLVGPLSAHELREAIERPAQLAGCEIEPGLVELLVDDVLHQPGALPLLQYGLLRMWKRPERIGRRITTDDYRAVGQLNGIIEKRVEVVFHRFTEPQQELCRRLFLRLTEPGEGTEDTKRRVPWRELTSTRSDADDVSDVVKTLADERLLTTTGGTALTTDSTVEVAHESLIRNWTRLRDWIETDRAGLRLHRRLTEAAEEWVKKNRDPGLLDHGTRLTLTSEWATKHEAELSDPEREFLAASLQRQRSELDAARQTAARFKRLSFGLAAAVLVAGGLATVAWRQTEVARENEASAKNEKRHAQQNLAMNHLSKAGFAIREHRTADALHWYFQACVHAPEGDWVSRSALGSLGARSRSLYLTLVHEGRVNAVAFSPDGRTVLTGGDDKTAQLWDARTGQARGEPLKHDGSVYAVAFSPDGQTVLTAVADFLESVIGAHLWDVRTGQARGESLTHKGIVHAVAFSPDGQMVLTGSRDKTARLWDVRTGQARCEPMRHEGGVNAVAFSPDGQIVVTASGDTARFWNVPPPAADEADPKRPHLRLSIEVRTGSELDENSGTIKWLTQAEWLKRQARLWKEFHGPCDVRTWDQASDDEKRRLRTPSKE